MPTNLRANCVVVGDTATGKSSICQVFHSDGSHFPKNYSLTTGVDLLVKAVSIPETHDLVELYIWDSAGKEIYSETVQKYAQFTPKVEWPIYTEQHCISEALGSSLIKWDHPSVVIVVYDVTNQNSFNSCSKWLERVRSKKPEMIIPGVLLANKIDLDERRIISPKMGKEFASANGLEYFECSAKEMQNTDGAFYFLANEFHKMYREKTEFFATLS